MELNQGTTISRYVVDSRLFDDEYASTYRIRHRHHKSDHLLRILKQVPGDVRQHLVEHGPHQVALRHPNIIRVTDVLEVEGAPAMVLDWVDGPTLAQLIRTQQLSEDQLDQLASGLIQGLACAHHHGLIHRSVSPERILVGVKDGKLRPVWVDFGVSTLLGWQGPLRYRAPEQLRNARDGNESSDLYGVGAVLYEAAARRPAFQGATAPELIREVARGPSALRGIRPSLPLRMVQAVDASMSLRPETRPKDCHALLSLWLGQPTRAYDPAAVIAQRIRPRVEPATVISGPSSVKNRAVQTANAPSVAEVLGFQGTDRYVVRRRLGSGAVGMVYEGYDRRRKSVVALKTLENLSSTAVYRFKQEFRALAEVKHSNLAGLYELVAADDLWFIAMELVHGTSFLRFIRGKEEGEEETTTLLSHDGLEEAVQAVASRSSDDHLPTLAIHLDRLKDALTQLLQGVAALHRAGRLHRDIKPSNVLVTPDGRVVLVDFGLVYDTNRTNSELSRVDTIVGTAAYMSPEQALSAAPTPPADLYSVGVMLYQVLTGRLPFEGTLVDVLTQKQLRDPAPPSSVVAGIPEVFDTLCLDLMQRNPSARPTADEALKRLGVSPTELPDERRVTRSTFMGRDAELQVLEDAWTRVRNGRAVTVDVSGPAGVGKTALIKRFLGSVKRFEDVLLLRSRCLERESVPFKAFDSMMDGVTRKLGRLGDEAVEQLLPTDLSALSLVFPVLGELRPLERPEPIHPSEARSRVLQTSAELLRNLCRRSPVVVFVDDAQWGDLDSARMLVSWLAALSRSRLLVLLAYRDDEIASSPFLAGLKGDPVYQRAEVRTLSLGALPETTTLEVARRIVDPKVPERPRALDWIVRESSGHPDLIYELANALVSEEGLAWEQLLDRNSLHDVLRLRFMKLSEQTQNVLVAVAIAGRPIPVQLISQAMDIDSSLGESIDELLQHRFVRTTQTSTPHGELIELYHSRLSRSVLQGLTDQRRSRIHGRLAVTMERAQWGEAEALMQHYLSAGNRSKASAYALEAAEQALDSIAFDRATELYKTALALGTLTGAASLDVQRRLVDTLAYSGRGREAAELLLTLKSSSAEERSFRRRAAELYLHNGYFTEGRPLVVESLAEAKLQEPLPGVAGKLRILWLRWLLRLRGSGFEARPESRVERTELDRIDVAWFVGLAHQLLDPTLGFYFHSVSLFDALRAGEPFRVARSQGMELVLLVGSGQIDWDTQRHAFQDLRQRVSKLNQPHASHFLTLAEGMSAYLQGQFKHGYRVLRVAEKGFVNQTADGLFELALARIFMLRCLLFTGDLRLATELQSRLTADAQERGNMLLLAGLRADLAAWIHLASNEPSRVTSGIKPLYRHWEADGGSYQLYFLMRGEIYRTLYEHRFDKAREVLERANRLYTNLGLKRMRLQRLTHGFLTAMVSLGARLADPTSGSWSETQQIRLVIRKMERDPHRLGRPLALCIRACLASQAGQTMLAIQHLETAQKLFDRADVLLYANAAKWMVGILRDETAEGPNLSIAGGWLRHQGVVAPDEFCRMLLPGFQRPTSLEKR